jgi:hypothetical protein
LLFQFGDERIHFGIAFAQCLDALNTVADGRVITAVVETSDYGRAPPANMPRQMHRDLPIEARWLRVSGNPSWPKPSRNGGIYLR